MLHEIASSQKFSAKSLKPDVTDGIVCCINTLVDDIIITVWTIQIAYCPHSGCNYHSILLDVVYNTFLLYHIVIVVAEWCCSYYRLDRVI